ncbi:DUF229 domain-containing protein [Puteibacter caeruleilacunae]|nr:DUF229 domain-containing protein [Puteibacter caeruleilacunae]
MRKNKLNTLLIVGAGALMFQSCGVKQAEQAEAKKPNVLFISVDDLNDWIGVMKEKGHPDAKTPNLDRLAKRGVYFTNTHCTSAACTPSRLSVMSGLSPISTGCYTNKSGVRNWEVWNEVTLLPAYLRQNGYYTMASGKIEGAACHKIEPKYENQKMWDERMSRKYQLTDEVAKDGAGYGGIDFFPFPMGGSKIKNEKPQYKGHSLCAGALDRDYIPGGKMPDELSTDWVVERLARDYDKPFFLGLGLVRPHVPYTAPKEFFDMYPIDEITIPEDPEGEMDDIPLYAKAIGFGAFEPGDERMVREMGPDYRKQLVQGYLACITFMDSQLGRVLDALDNSKYADNTIIVLWSDHGQSMGEKRSWRKQCLWHESTSSPMVWVVPGMTDAGSLNNQPTSLMDIYPTVTDLCGLPAMKGIDAESMVPLLKDSEAKRDYPVLTTWSYGSHSLRGERWRYIRYFDGSEELYDGLNDFGEHHNLAGDPKYKEVIEGMKKFLPEEKYEPTEKNAEFQAYKKRAAGWKANPKSMPVWLQ